MDASSIELDRSRLMLNPDLLPVHARDNPTRTHALCSHGRSLIDLPKPKPPKLGPRPPSEWPTLVFDPSKASTSKAAELPASPEASAVAQDSRPFLLASAQKPVFNPKAASLSDPEREYGPVFSLPSRRLAESSYVLADKTLTASALAPSAESSDADPTAERVYPRVFYLPGEKREDDALTSTTLSSTIYESATPSTSTSMYASATASTVTLTASPTKLSESRVLEAVPRRDTSKLSSKILVADREDLTASTFCDFTWRSGGSPDNTGSTHASSFELQPRDPTDSDSGWEVTEVYWPVREWSEDSFDELDSEEPTNSNIYIDTEANDDDGHVYEHDNDDDGLIANAMVQSIYYDARDSDSPRDLAQVEAQIRLVPQDTRAEDGVVDEEADLEDDGYSADSEAVPRLNRFVAHRGDDLEASLSALIPRLNAIRARRRSREEAADEEDD